MGFDPFDDDKPRMLAELNRVYISQVPQNAALGLTLTDFEPGVAVMRLPYAEKLIGNPHTGVIHGGAVTSLMDATCGAAVFMRLRIPQRIATLDLRIDYLRPAEPGRDVVARATCYALTKHVAFVRATATTGDAVEVAAAAGTFMVFGDTRSVLAEGLSDD